MNNTYDSELFAKLEDGTGYNQTNSSDILNKYVNFMNYKNTQSLADSLTAEAIQMRGVDMYYLPREFQKLDLLFGEDPSAKFDKAWKFAGYIESFEGYEGDGTEFNRFGMSVNDEIKISINPNLFKYQTNDTEPTIGDLLYFPLDNSLFEINWVQPYNPFYQMGQNAQRRITAEKFIYNGEELQPKLQRNAGINISEFSELDLKPLNNLDGTTDLFKDEYSEVDSINKEASDFVKDFVVINGVGDKNTSTNIQSAFDDEFSDDY